MKHITKRSYKSEAHRVTNGKEFLPDLKEVSLVFLGVGLTMFLLNITAMLVFIPEQYSFVAFDIAIFASIILILIPIYYLTNLN
jgi:hypothetical protein